MGAVLGVEEPPDAPIAAVQALLKDQRLYSGPVDGMESPAMAAAVRRYQILHGFTATGRLDEATLAAMLVPTPRSKQLTESDREVLKELETVTPPAVAELRREPIPPGPPVAVAASPSPTPAKGRRASVRKVERVKPARISRSLPGD